MDRVAGSSDCELFVLYRPFALPLNPYRVDRDIVLMKGIKIDFFQEASLNFSSRDSAGKRLAAAPTRSFANSATSKLE